MKNSFFSEVKHCFETGSIDHNLNQILFSLIPKKTNLTTPADFRPISLSNTIYKTITKLIAEKIKPFLPDLISPFQTSFIKGRSTVDNAILAQEMTNLLAKKTGRKSLIMISINLAKAYDCLEWSFIRSCLHHFNIPPKLIKLILACISTPSSTFLINGRKSDIILP